MYFQYKNKFATKFIKIILQTPKNTLHVVSSVIIIMIFPCLKLSVENTTNSNCNMINSYASSKAWVQLSAI